MNDVLYTTMESPVGRLLVIGDEQAITGISMHGQRWAPPIDHAWKAADDPFRVAVRQLEEYFAGERREFDLALRIQGTAFRLRVWEALTTIPFGRTCSYGDIADRIARPGAARAVGAANGHNPMAIVVPCHRVIGARGTLVGYGGGLERKSWLIEHEASVLADAT